MTEQIRILGILFEITVVRDYEPFELSLVEIDFIDRPPADMYVTYEELAQYRFDV
jgi:hypothetical protein